MDKTLKEALVSMGYRKMETRFKGDLWIKPLGYVCLVGRNKGEEGFELRVMYKAKYSEDVFPKAWDKGVLLQESTDYLKWIKDNETMLLRINHSFPEVADSNFQYISPSDEDIIESKENDI